MIGMLFTSWVVPSGHRDRGGVATSTGGSNCDPTVHTMSDHIYRESQTTHTKNVNQGPWGMRVWDTNDQFALKGILYVIHYFWNMKVKYGNSQMESSNEKTFSWLNFSCQ
jgi:hypothetical protein